MTSSPERKNKVGGFRTETAAAVLWFALVVAGMGFLARYANTPGEARMPASESPAASLRTNGHLPLLVMSLHPRCACSQASLAELERVLALSPARCQAVILFAKPKNEPDEWVRSKLYSRAASSGCAIRIDEDGALSSELGALTSGHVLLFGPNNQLLFSGGITGARAHEGDNAGKDALLAALRGETPALVAKPLPVFGCALAGEAPARPQETKPSAPES